MLKYKVSIIIPCFNSDLYLNETLNSTIIQTYKYWECIFVDDGSTDNTIKILKEFSSKDSRIKFFIRPKHLPRGANACRNYGFEKSSGDYIQFFDSDDLMVPDFLEKKVFALEKNNADYVVSKTLNFKDPNPNDILHKNESYYQFENYPVTHFNYVAQNINWLTPDFMAKRDLAKRASFNENLSSAQERNYFSKITALSTNIFVLDEYLTYRRIHNNSTQTKLRKNKKDHKYSYFKYCYETYFDLKNIGSKKVRKYLLMECVEYSLYHKLGFSIIFAIFREYNHYEFKASLWYLIYQLSDKLTGKGHFFRKNFRSLQDQKDLEINEDELLEKPFINILTRTSGRPKGFKELHKSLQIHNYPGLRHLVSYDHKEDLQYLEHFKAEKIEVSPVLDPKADPEEYKPYNLYCNTLLEQVQQGWILILDDDNKLYNQKSLKILAKEISKADEDTLLIFQTSYPNGSRIPEDIYFKKQSIEKYHIDTACVVFHSKYKSAAKWDSWRTADYRFIRDLAKAIPKQNWIKRSLTYKFNFGDLGRRNDIY